MGSSDIDGLQLHKLRELVKINIPNNRFIASKWQAVNLNPDDLQTGADLNRIPFTTKAELLEDQIKHPPYGSNLAQPLEKYVRLHQTSGTTTGHPLRWLDTDTSWRAILHCWELIFEVAGLVPKDRLYFPFSFGPFLGFWAAFEGAARKGHLVLPGGGASTSARIKFLLENSATVVCCTPTYALRMAEVASEEGVNLKDSAVRMLILAGEPGANIGSTKKRIADAWNALVLDHWGMTEVGPLTIESPDRMGGMYVLESECIAEVIDQNTGQPVPDGMEGELVITTLYRVDSPVIRYRTGDLVKFDPSHRHSRLGWRWLPGGILGRTDDMILYRGNNIYPSMLEAVVREFAEVDEFQIVIDHRAALPEMRLRIEVASGSKSESICKSLGQAIEHAYQFHPIVEAVPFGTLPHSEMKSKRVVQIR